jgi:hypothetical protein
MSFRRFVAIDWSGARDDQGKGLAGIQVASCEAGVKAPSLVANPSGGSWRRTDVLSWLEDRATDGEPILVGFDFAFSFPYCGGREYMPGLDTETPAELWRLVEDLSSDAPELNGMPFILDPRFVDSFWSSGRRPQSFSERHRETEVACRDQDGGRPESVFKILGPKQVGLGSLAGMRVLTRLTRLDGVSIWPFDEATSGLVCVEIFPRHFLMRARHGTRKVTTKEDLDAVLAGFDCESADLGDDAIDDHKTDALVSAAGLRYVAGSPEIWNPPSMSACARKHEGWIFGVV